MLITIIYIVYFLLLDDYLEYTHCFLGQCDSLAKVWLGLTSIYLYQFMVSRLRH